MEPKTCNKKTGEKCDVEEELMKCKTEVGQQIEGLRSEFLEFKQDHSEMMADIKEVLSIFRTTKGFGRFMGWIKTAAQWSAGLLVPAVAIWAALKGAGKWLIS